MSSIWLRWSSAATCKRASLIGRIGPQIRKKGDTISKIWPSNPQNCGHQTSGASWGLLVHCVCTHLPLRDCCDLASCMLHNGQVGYNIMPGISWTQVTPKCRRNLPWLPLQIYRHKPLHIRSMVFKLKRRVLKCCESRTHLEWKCSPLQRTEMCL